MDTLANDEFRVLNLLPGENDEPLRCELQTCSFADHPPFETISYVWSIKPDPVNLEVDGRIVVINEGLKDILRRIRQPSTSRVLWIDRLCINQSDIQEKTAQVSQMREIYSNCTRVLVWIGELEEENELADAAAAFSVLEYFARFDPGEGSDSGSETSSNSGTGSKSETSSVSEEDPTSNTSSASGESPEHAITTPIPECIGSEESFGATMEALGRIGPVRGTWWHRVWTVQEVMLPPDATFLWGPFSITWATMEAVNRTWLRSYSIEEVLSDSQLGMLTGPGNMGDLMTHVIWMKHDRESGKWPMHTSIQWRQRSATMPVDNVYALTGLHDPGVLPRSEKCDYALDMKQVSINYTLDLIHLHEDGGNLLPLVIDPRRETEVAEGVDERGKNTSSRLPRWAVDMHSFPKHDTVPWRQYRFYYRFEANKGFSRDCDPHCDDDHTLLLSGVAVDTIALVGEGHHVTERDIGLYPPAQPVLRAWWNLYCTSGHLEAVAADVLYCGLEPGNCAAYDRFCRLVLGEILADGEHDPQEDASLRDGQDVARYMRTGEPVDGRLRDTLAWAIRNRRFFVTRDGRMGLGHLETQPGDEVWVFSHGRVPFTLRPRRGEEGRNGGGDDDVDGRSGLGEDGPGNGDDDYDFVGACHVQGIMFGDDAVQEAAERGQRVVRLY